MDVRPFLPFMQLLAMELTETDVRRMKVEELRTELKKRGISFTYHDRKAGLIAMLLTAIETATHDEDNADTDFLYPDTVQVVDSILPDDDSKGGFALAKPGEGEYSTHIF